MKNKEIMIFNNEEELKIDSREIAEMMGVKHYQILEKLEGTKTHVGIIDYIIETNVSKYFIKSDYKDASGKKNKCYLFTKMGIKFFIDNSRKNKKIILLTKWFNNNFDCKKIEPIYVTDRFETTFMKKLQDTLKPLGYKLLTQYRMFDGKYRIDGYIKELNLAIEYDESQHFTKENSILDKIREDEIKNELKCKFVRCNYKNTDAYNIGLVMKSIMGVIG